MEHNEYAVHRCTVRFMQNLVDRSVQDESPVVGHQEVVREFLIVAPAGELGEAVLKIHLAKQFRYGRAKLASGEMYCLEKRVEEKLHGIVRYEDRYRAQL